MESLQRAPKFNFGALCRSYPFLSLLFGYFLICVSVVLGGCTISEPPADLRIINGKEPETLDPGLLTGQPDGRVALSLFEGLTRYNAVTAEPEPGLAESWTISDDGKTYTFSLRPNLKWSTGEPITAGDVVFSWLRVLNPDTASDYAGNLYYIEGAEAYNNGELTDPSKVGVKALGDRTVVVQLVNPTPFFLDLCAFSPQAVVPPFWIKKHGDLWLNKYPVPCSGSYDLVSWRLNDKIRVRKNPYYWDAANTHCEVVDFLPANNPATALNLFLSGQVDIVWDKDVVPTGLPDVLKTRKDFHPFNYLGSYFYRYNLTRKPLDDPRVRKALALVVDKKRIVERVLKGSQLPASFLVPPGVPNYNPPEGLGYDPEEGRRLLAEAGYPGGKGFPRLTYLSNTSRDHEKIAIELQDMWKKELGISVELRAVEWKVYLRMQSSLDYDISRSSWVGDYADPNTFLDMFMSNNPNNRTGYKSDAYDALIREANGTRDVKQREKLLQRAEMLLVKQDLPIVPLYIYVGMNFFDPDVISGVYNNIRDEHPVRTIQKKVSK
ncbi:MAG: peptide ABC transporter substrate-binding protein [Verrucomicrobiales bacterium]